MQAQNNEYAKEKKLSKSEKLIQTLRKQLERAEVRASKYKKYYKEVKEIAIKIKQKYDEINLKLNDFFSKKVYGQGEITTKDLTGERALNTSVVINILILQHNHSGDDPLEEEDLELDCVIEMNDTADFKKDIQTMPPMKSSGFGEDA